MKIVLDECILNKKLRKQFRETGGYDYKTCFEIGCKAGDADEVLVEKAGEFDHLVLTIDFRTITEEKFPPCNHGGILSINRNVVTPEYIIQRLEALRTLELEKKAIGHFTYLNEDGIKIVTHTETIEARFEDYDEYKDIEK